MSRRTGVKRWKSRTIEKGTRPANDLDDPLRPLLGMAGCFLIILRYPPCAKAGGKDK